MTFLITTCSEEKANTNKSTVPRIFLNTLQINMYTIEALVWVHASCLNILFLFLTKCLFHTINLQIITEGAAYLNQIRNQKRRLHVSGRWVGWGLGVSLKLYLVSSWSAHVRTKNRSFYSCFSEHSLIFLLMFEHEP